MKVASMISEAHRNVVTGTSHAVTCMLTLIFLTTVITGFDIMTVLALQQQSREWVQSGAAIHMLMNEREINPDTCSSLSSTIGTLPVQTRKTAAATNAKPIRASGALRENGDITLDAMTAAPLPLYQVTPGLAEVLGMDTESRTRNGVWISTQLASTLHTQAGSTFTTDQGHMQIAGVFSWPDDQRDQRIAYAILSPATIDGQYDECWAMIWPNNPAAIELLNTAALALPSASTAATIRQANTAMGNTLDLWELYRHRISRFITPLAPIAAFTIAWASTRARRIELADALHMGIPRSTLQVITSLETLSWSLPALSAAAVLNYIVAVTLSNHSNAKTLLFIQLPMLAASLLTSQLGTVAALQTITTKRLFAYFKARR